MQNVCSYVMWTLRGQCSAVGTQQFAPEQQGLSIVTAAGDHITLQDYDASGALSVSPQHKSAQSHALFLPLPYATHPAACIK